MVTACISVEGCTVASPSARSTTWTAPSYNANSLPPLPTIKCHHNQEPHNLTRSPKCMIIVAISLYALSFTSYKKVYDQDLRRNN